MTSVIKDASCERNHNKSAAIPCAAPVRLSQFHFGAANNGWDALPMP